jgi:hypothetical protein
MRRVTDRDTGAATVVAIACGSTREHVCPPCADKARRLRAQQCAEGWHLTDDPLRHDDTTPADNNPDDDPDDDPDAGLGDELKNLGPDEDEAGSRRVRSCPATRALMLAPCPWPRRRGSRRARSRTARR